MGQFDITNVGLGATGERELQQMLTEEDFNRLQLTTLEYCLHESNPANGLVRDKTDTKAPASISAVGLQLASIPFWSNAGW